MNEASVAFNRKRVLVALSVKGEGALYFDHTDGSRDLASFDCQTFAEFLVLITWAVEQYIDNELTKRCTLVVLNPLGDLSLKPHYQERLNDLSLELASSSDGTSIDVFQQWQRGLDLISERFNKAELVELFDQN